MQYLLTRITAVPNSPLKIMVDQPPEDGKDAGLAVGGSFWFEPAGQDGSSYQVGEFAAKSIMGDPSLAVHFRCDPPLDAPAVQEAQDVPAAERKGKGRG